MTVTDDFRDIPNEDIPPPPPVNLDARRGNTRPPRPPRNDARVPPHDLAAEAALLGAILASSMPEPVEAAIGVGLEPGDFYKPAHGHIYGAVVGLHGRGEPVEPVGVAAELHRLGVLEQCGGHGALAQLMVDTPAISNAARYARIVDEHARMRRMIAAAGDLADLGYSLPADVAQAEAKAATILTFKPRGGAVDAYTDLDAFLDVDEPDHDWIIPGLLETADRVIITAHAGTGKSTLLRQIGVMCAAGLHPFDVTNIAAVNVLLLDVENSERQVRREIRPLRQLIGSRYQPARFMVRVFGEAINIADPATLAGICRAVEQHQPGIILMGPLYKLIAGSPIDEEPARAVADAFDRIRHVCGSALIIEAHTPYASGSKKRELRPYGASLWERWPEYGWHFDPAGQVEHWRGQREQRSWPDALERSKPWPWAPRNRPEPARVDTEPWDGPTRCIDAIVAFLDTNTGEYSKNQLGEQLRARGVSYMDKTISEAAERAAVQGRIGVRAGSRNGRYFTAKQPEIAVGDDGGMF